MFGKRLGKTDKYDTNGGRNTLQHMRPSRMYPKKVMCMGTDIQRVCTVRNILSLGGTGVIGTDFSSERHLTYRYASGSFICSEYGDVVHSLAVGRIRTGTARKCLFFFGTEICIVMRAIYKTLPQPRDEKWVIAVTIHVDRTT